MGNALGRGWGVRIPNDAYTHSPIGAAISQGCQPLCETNNNNKIDNSTKFI